MVHIANSECVDLPSPLRGRVDVIICVRRGTRPCGPCQIIKLNFLLNLLVMNSAVFSLCIILGTTFFWIQLKPVSVMLMKKKLCASCTRPDKKGTGFQINFFRIIVVSELGFVYPVPEIVAYQEYIARFGLMLMPKRTRNQNKYLWWKIWNNDMLRRLRVRVSVSTEFWPYSALFATLFLWEK